MIRFGYPDLDGLSRQAKCKEINRRAVDGVAVSQGFPPIFRSFDRRRVGRLFAGLVEFSLSTMVAAETLYRPDREPLVEPLVAIPVGAPFHFNLRLTEFDSKTDGRLSDASRQALSPLVPSTSLRFRWLMDQSERIRNGPCPIYGDGDPLFQGA